MFVEEVDHYLIHLLWKFLMNKMVPFFQKDTVQIWNNMLQKVTLYVVYHTRETKHIVLLTQNQQCWCQNFWISYSTAIYA